jgi:hypothetical protein
MSIAPSLLAAAVGVVARTAAARAVVGSDAGPGDDELARSAGLA